MGSISSPPGSGGGGGGSPGGSNTQVQYNNAGAFGGISGATTNGTNLLVTTQPSSDNSTKAASTAYVQAQASTYTANAASVGGTANAITISATQPTTFNLVDGAVITFSPINFNTGATTLNVVGTGAIAINKVTANGFAPVVAGDISPSPLIVQYIQSSSIYLALNIIQVSYETTVSTNQSIGFGNLWQAYVATSAVTFTIAQTTTLTSYWWIDVYALGGAVTVTPNAADAINGGSVGAGATILRGTYAKVITDANGNLYIQNINVNAGSISLGKIGTAYGGTNADSSSSTGVAQVNSGTWSFSTALANGTTATTQSAGDNTTNVATDAFVTTAVNNAIAGVNPAVAVKYATTAAGDTSALTYNNGVSGIGATLTGANNATTSMDGHTFVVGDVGVTRVLVKNDTQSPSGAFNGIYLFTALHTAGTGDVFTRAVDYDMPSDINSTGAIPVVNGTVNANTSWLLTSTVNTVGTDPLTYVQFSIAPSTIVVNNASNTYTTGTQDFTSATALKVPNSGGAAPTAEASTAYDTTQHKYVAGVNGGTTGSFPLVVNVDNATNTSGNNLVAATINTTETVFASNYTVKANTFIKNKTLRVTAVFDIASSATAVSFRTRLRWGGLTGTIISDTGAVSVNNTAQKGQTQIWLIQGTAAAGASANIEVGKILNTNLGQAPLGPQAAAETIQSPVAVATNADAVLTLTEQFGGNTAANSITLRQWIVEELN